MSYASLIDSTKVRQTERLDARQVKNNAGGFVYELDMFARLDRFLILGSDSPTYYQSARKLTRENAKCVVECWDADARRTAARVVEISTNGRAPKNSAAIFALALGAMSEDVDTRRAAVEAVEAVCRTATHIFEFASLLDALGRGWGRTVRRAVRKWYETPTADKLAYQMTKYRSRHDYTHERMIQRAHPPASDGNGKRVALYRWACGGHLLGHELPEIVVGHLVAMRTEKASELVPLIERHRLTWEQIPTWSLGDARVWEALLPNLGLTALLRNLGTLSALGVVKPLGVHTATVADRFRDVSAVRASRLHPYTILNALAVYRSGKAVKGERTWPVVQAIVDALEDAFYLAFANVEPTGKRIMLALDVSGSMAFEENKIGGVLTAREAAAAMAMVTARSEKHHHFVAFSDGIADLAIGARMSLPEVVNAIQGLPFKRTDCAAPMLHALDKGLEVDTFVVYTDNETYHGAIHPKEALRKYRRETGIPAKLIVVGMSSTGFTIADPRDGGMMDVVGFDSEAVSIMADFIRS